MTFDGWRHYRCEVCTLERVGAGIVGRYSFCAKLPILMGKKDSQIALAEGRPDVAVELDCARVPPVRIVVSLIVKSPFG